jgi:murein DD-endopeptidase MepM/ murein hydrolase activator NlpD
LVFAAAYSTITWAVDISRVGRLERRNATIETELQKMQLALGELADTMSALTNRDSKFRLLAGLPLNDPDVQQAGVGGPAPTSETELLLTETPLGRRAVDARENLSGLIRRAQFLASSFQEAVDTLARQQTLLAHTPSITPTAGYLSSPFSTARLHPVYNEVRPHLGMDIVAPRGTPILAPADGRVVDVGRQVGYGKLVTIDHGNGIRTRYAHCDEIMVRPGQRVSRGDEVARVGRTGVTTNYHLHYEVLVNGRQVDPRNFIFGDVIVD